MVLVSILLHFNACNASNLVLKILEHDKMWGTIGNGVPQCKFWGTRPVIPPPVNYAHAVQYRAIRAKGASIRGLHGGILFPRHRPVPKVDNNTVNSATGE